MPQRIRASDISRQLGDAGHQHSHWEDDDWDPGQRTAQAGPRAVHVFHDGHGEEHQLGLYALALTNLGYTVTHDQQPNNGRRHLTITKP
jgi:hypothetical protein